MPSIQSSITEELYLINAGDVTDFVYVRPTILDGGAIDANWSCVTWVVDEDGNTVVEETAITEKSASGNEFKVYLTSGQTAPLGAGTSYAVEYDWNIKLSNTTLSPNSVRTLRLKLGVI